MINYYDLFEKRQKSGLKLSHIINDGMLPPIISDRMESSKFSIVSFSDEDFSQTASVLDMLDPFEILLEEFAEERAKLMDQKYNGVWDSQKEARFNYLSDSIEKYRGQNPSQIDLASKYAFLAQSIEVLKSSLNAIRYLRKKYK